MRKSRVLSALITVAFLLSLLAGCAGSLKKGNTSIAPVARVNEHGTTLLTELDNTDEAVFVTRYRRNNVSLWDLDQAGLSVDTCVRFGDDYVIMCKIMTGPAFSGNVEEEYTSIPKLVVINSTGTILLDLSDACMLRDSYTLRYICGNGEVVFLCYDHDGYGSNGTDYIIARLEPDGSVTELFQPERFGEDWFIYNMLGTEDGIFVFGIIVESGVSKNTIQHYDITGDLLDSVIPDETCNHMFALDNCIYIGGMSNDGSQTTVVYQLEPDRLMLRPVAHFDSGRLINIDKSALYIADGTNVFRYDLATGESLLLVDLMPSGLSYINWLMPVLGGDFLSFDQRTDQLFFLREELTTETDNRKQIILGTINNVRPYTNAILEFNLEQTEYQIVIRDYSKYPNPIQLLNTELIAGMGPDILDTVELSADVLHSGMLVDLLPYLEADPDIDTSDFFPAVFEQLKTDGKLLTAVPAYLVYSLVTCEDDYPDGINGLDAFFDAASDEGTYYRYLWSREMFLQSAFCGNTISNYTEADIANILRFSADLLTEDERFVQDADREHQREIAAGRQKMFLRRFGGTDSVLMEELSLETTLKPLGLPFAPQNTGMIIPRIELGITASSEVKDGAWAFIRTMYLPAFQNQLGAMTYPILQSAYANAEKIYSDRWAQGYWVTADFGDRADEVYLDHALGLSCAREVLSAPYGVYHANEAVMGFVSSAAEEFYAGKSTAEDAAHIIFSKLKLYFAERE